MTLPGPNAAISLNQVNTELGVSPAATTISMNQANVRTLAGLPSGQIAMSDLWGKSNVPQIANIVVTMPHPQAFPTNVEPSRIGNAVQFNAGPIPGYPGPTQPSPATYTWGSSCSPNSLARQLVVSAGPSPALGPTAAPNPGTGL